MISNHLKLNTYLILIYYYKLYISYSEEFLLFLCTCCHSYQLSVTPCVLYIYAILQVSNQFKYLYFSVEPVIPKEIGAKYKKIAIVRA